MSLFSIFKKPRKVRTWFIVLDNEQDLSKSQLEHSLTTLCSSYRDYPYTNGSFETEMAEHGVYVYNQYYNLSYAQGIFEHVQSHHIKAYLLDEHEYERLINHNLIHKIEYVSYNGTKVYLHNMIEDKPLDQAFIERATKQLEEEEQDFPINGMGDVLDNMFEQDLIEPLYPEDDDNDEY